MIVMLTAPDDNALFQIYEPGTTVGRDGDGLLECHAICAQWRRRGRRFRPLVGPLAQDRQLPDGGRQHPRHARYSMGVKIE
jgi:hypothetical protein